MNFSIFDNCDVVTFSNLFNSYREEDSEEEVRKEEEYFEEEVRKAYGILCSQLAKITAEKRTLLRNHLYYSPVITSLERKERELVAAIDACIDYLRTRALK